MKPFGPKLSKISPDSDPFVIFTPAYPELERY